MHIHLNKLMLNINLYFSDFKSNISLGFRLGI